MGSEEKQMQSPVERKEIGSWLREQREAHCWSRPEMARQLIRAAHAASDRSIVKVDNLCHNIYRWEKGAVGPSERYRLYYCKVLGIPPAAFGGATETAKTGTLVLPRGFGGEVGKLLNLLDVEHGVSLRAESSTIAVRIARELSEGMTQAGRIATHEFLVEVAQAVRWPQRGLLTGAGIQMRSTTRPTRRLPAHPHLATATTARWTPRRSPWRGSVVRGRRPLRSG